MFTLKAMRSVVLMIGIGCTAFHAQAADNLITGVAVEYGNSGQNSDLKRFSLQSNWNKSWFASNGTHFNGYWDLSIAQWTAKKYNNISGNSKDIYDIGFTPVIRFEAIDQRGLYAEAGIGLHVMSRLYKNEDRVFSTAFQFGDHIGVGYVFNNGLDLGIRLQHFSNASIKRPNPGENFAVVRAAYNF